MNTADICDAMPDAQILAPEFADYGAVANFFGEVETIRAFEDNSLVRQAVAEPGKGRVLVIDGGASLQRAMLGGNLGQMASDNGWAGVVVNGCVRDTQELIEFPIGIRALGSCPRKTDKNGHGERGVVVGIGGVKIAPGNWLYADDDGMVLCQSEARLD